jgi:hypothetical protein
MVFDARSLRAALVAISILVAVAGCGGLGGHVNDVSPIDGGPADLTPLGPDGAQAFLDSAPIRLDASNPQPDAESGLGIGSLEAGSAEAGGSTDTIPSSADTGVATETPAPPPATIVVLPDTQYYASNYPDVFTSQTSWIVEQKSALSIAAVLHVGDIVDDANSAAQWTVANTAMRQLDGLVPYVLVPGNHDTDATRNGLIDSYFAPATMPWITGTMADGQIENNFTLVDIGPQKWLVLGLEFGPRDAVMTWADAVLKAYPNLPAIIVTHAYLYSDGKRYDIAISGNDMSKKNYQYWIPQYYGYTASEGINDGEQIWEKLILPNPNVRLVFSGHMTGAARLSSARPDGSIVHQMLSDYQWFRSDKADYYGGGGYLRVLQFDYGKKEIRVATYSPYLDQYLTDDANQFAVSLEL